MSDHAGRTAELLQQVLDKIAQGGRLERGTVLDVAGALVTVLRGEAEDPTDEGEVLARLAGVALGEDDEVVIAPMGGGYVVLGLLASSAPTVLAMQAPLIGQMYHKPNSASAAEQPTSTNTGVWQPLLTTTWTVLPPGTYTVALMGEAGISHSTAGTVKIRFSITTPSAGDHGEKTLAMPNLSPATAPFRTTAEVANVVVTGDLVVVFEFQNQVVGQTATARNPLLQITATRTA